MIRGFRIICAIVLGIIGTVSAMAQNFQSNAASVNSSTYLMIGGAAVVVAVGAAIAFTIAKRKSKR